MKQTKRHRRLSKTFSVRLSDIKVPESTELDQSLIKANVDFQTGKIPASLSRIRTSEISSGFFTRADDGTISHVSGLDPKWVDAMKAKIRGGARPILDLHWDPHRPPNGGFACADDEITLAAYQQLGISLVPCRIMRPKPILKGEAALWIQIRGNQVRLFKAIPPEVCDGFAAFKLDDAATPLQALSALMAICDETAKAIQAFHQEDENSPDYHQMLFVLVQRHMRALDTIYRLLQLDRMEHALGIVRMAYEAFLNFYVDWLSPEFMGPRLHALAKIRSLGKYDKDKSHPLLEGLANFTEFLENTAEKARVSPLGTLYHDIVYPPLSLIAHQSYRNIEREAYSFTDFSEPAHPMPAEKLVIWINVVTTALLKRVQNDIGVAS